MPKQTVTVTSVIPTALGDTLSLTAPQRLVGAVLSIDSNDAETLIRSGLAAFGSAAATQASSDAGNAVMVKGIPLTVDAGVALAAAAVLTGATQNLGDSHRFGAARLFAVSDQAGTAVIEQSLDGTTWQRVTAPAAIPAAGAVIVEQNIAAPFVRGVITNGATAATAVKGILNLINV